MASDLYLIQENEQPPLAGVSADWRVMIVEAEIIFARGLEQAVREMKGFAVVGTYHSYNECFVNVPSLKPHILLIDARLIGDHIERIAWIRQTSPSTRIIVIMGVEDSTKGFEFLKEGVLGILTPWGGCEAVFASCIKYVSEGLHWVTPQMSEHLIHNWLDNGTPQYSGEESALPTFKPREVEILMMVRRSMRNKEIAQELKITEGTVKNIVHKLMVKCEVKSRQALMDYVSKRGESALQGKKREPLRAEPPVN